MWSRRSLNSAGVRKTVSSTRVCGKRRPTHGLVAITPARTAALKAPETKRCLLEIVFPLPPICFTRRAIVVSVTADTRQRAEHGADVSFDVGAVPRERRRLDAGQIVDVGW
jgi:hypothetical protein